MVVVARGVPVRARAAVELDPVPVRNNWVVPVAEENVRPVIVELGVLISVDDTVP